MRLFEGKIIFVGSAEGIRNQIGDLLRYYGKDVQIRDLISTNLTPNQQYTLRDSGRVYR